MTVSSSPSTHHWLASPHHNPAKEHNDTKQGNSHNTTYLIAPTSLNLTLTTTQEQPTILRAFPVLSILHRPAHSPSFLLLSTLMSGIWCSLQRACTSFLYIGSLQFSARTHSKACRLQQQFHSNYHTASLTTPSTHKLHCTDSLYLLDHPPTVVLLMNMIKETNCAYRLQTVSLTNCPHMYGLHVKTRATAVLSIMIV